MKFRSDTKVIIDNIDNKVSIIIGPIIDRTNKNWSKYSVNIDTNEFKTIKNILINTKNNIIDNKIVILYSEFKKHFRINYVNKLEYECKMTREDFMNDIDFMRDEIMKCKISVNKYKQSDRKDLVIRYENLINNEQHKMFQVDTKEEYDNYLDHIENLITDYEKEAMDKMNIKTMTSWDNYNTDS